MKANILTTICYQEQDRQVSWCGVSMADEDGFKTFMANDVSSRLCDEEGMKSLESDLRNLATTGFARENLSDILAARTPESREWAIGEAVAEAFLSREHGITWPWNVERDKRTPLACLPGADLVGFEVNGDDVHLVIGEVKTSSDNNSPPHVMNGRSGMSHQIHNLASNLSLVCCLLRWLHPRCKGTKHEPSFRKAVMLLFHSGNKAIALFGVLVRDTQPNVLDLRARGQSLANTLQSPTTCQLFALYLPCAIIELPNRVSVGGS